jgi:hypothetical protein
MSAGEATLPALRMTQNSITLRLLLAHDINEVEHAAGIAELNQGPKEGRLEAVRKRDHDLPVRAGL